MKNQSTVLLVLGLACASVALRAADSTNAIHQKAIDVLRKTINNLENRQPSPATTAVPAAPPQPAFAEVEQLYLQGKLTAKEFQRYLEDHKLDPAKLAN